MRDLKQAALNYLPQCVLEIVENRVNMGKIWTLISQDFLYTCPARSEIGGKSPARSRISDSDSEEDEALRKPVNGLVILTKCLGSFPNEASDAFNAFKISLNEYISVQPKMSTSKIIEWLNKEDRMVKKCPLIRSIFDERKKWLKERTRAMPTFSWSMPNARLERYPNVEVFIRSTEERVLQEFHSSSEMQEFITYVIDEARSQRSFAIDFMRVSSKSLHIVKNRNYYEKILNRYIDNLNELNIIMEFLSS